MRLMDLPEELAARDRTIAELRERIAELEAAGDRLEEVTEDCLCQGESKQPALAAWRAARGTP